MATNVPRVTFGPTGFVAPSQEEVLAGVQEDIDAAFGGGLNPSLETPQGQLASSEAAVIGNTNDTFVDLTNQVNPDFSEGRFQDGIAAIYFLQRNPSQPTALQVACSGEQNVPIPLNAQLVDSSNNVYICVQAGVIPVGGSITLAFAALVPGPTPVPQTVKIYQAINGWDSATVVAGVIGNDVESQAEFELRRQQSVAANSVNANNSVLGAVLKVSGVLDAYVIDNPTNGPVTVGGFTLATRSLYVAVVGGAPADIAHAIWSKKPPGIPLNGNTVVVVQDANPALSPPFPSYNIQFEIPSSIAILYAVTIASSAAVPADAKTQVQNAIIAAFNGNTPPIPRARIGSTIYATQYASAIAALGSWALIKTILVGSNNTANAVFEAHVAVITGVSTMTVTRFVSGSGTLAAGQTVSGNDSLNALAPGTTIVAQLTGSAGGTGTYSLSNPLTLAGATFTGTGTGTSLAVTAVTGTIGIHDTIAGSGVPNGTTIDAQVSGTPGGAGTYTTSVATTAVAAGITAGAAVTATVADQNLVPVGIAQEPTIDANNISVAFT